MVRDEGGNLLPGVTVEYTLISAGGDRTPLCSAVSGSDGLAICKAPFITAAPGLYSIEAASPTP